MRLEERISKALKQVDNDRYILAIAVGQRADKLSKGAKPLLELNTQKMKYTDIANWWNCKVVLALKLKDSWIKIKISILLIFKVPTQYGSIY